MVRRGSRRSSATAASVSDSPTQTAMESGKVSPRRIRGSSPVNVHRPGSRSQLMRPRRSKRSSSDTHLKNPWTDGDHSDNEHHQNMPQHSTLDMVPSHWTTESGKFDPRQSEMTFDERSNVAINVNLRHSRNNNSDEKSLSNGSEDTHGDSSEDSPTNAKKKSKKKEILEGEYEDPHERRQFYKKLKKVGIKKAFEFEDDWESNSQNSNVSDISVGNASYILDLAQQTESRKKDRGEEALEEALELYGTWLTEGKSDDKNIFLMILHEVKKEQKAKYKKRDKKQAALLNQALDDELKRREQAKQEEKEREEEEEEERQKEEAKKKEAESDCSATVFKKKVARRTSFHTKKCEEKISEIITSQQSIDQAEEEDDHEKESCDGSNDSHHFSEDWSEEPDFAHVEEDDHHDESLEPSKPSSRTSRGFLKRFGSNRKLGKVSKSTSDLDGSSLHKRSSDADRNSFHKMSSDLDRNSIHKQSKGLFSRLRRQVSERNIEQWKEQETSWRENGHVLTAEEKWWAKINDAKKERVMFAQQKAMLDQTSSTLPIPQSMGMARLNFSTRTDPGFNGIPDTPPAKKMTMVTLDESHTSSSASPMPDQEGKSEKKKSKKKTDKNLDKIESSNDLTPDKKKKKKHNRRSSETGRTTPKSKGTRRSSDTGALPPLDLDATKSPNPKHKKKSKKKAKSLDSSGIEGIMELNDSSTKKKGKYSKYGQDDDSASVSSNRSSGSHKSSGKKKKAKGSKTRNSLEISPRKKKNKSLGSASRSFDSSEANSSRVGKKKKNKKTSRGSHGAFSDDSLYSDDTSVDWTDQEIVPSPSSETDAGETAITADSILQ